VSSIEVDFANGFLIGEILFKYQKIDNFEQEFINEQDANAKINNFMKLESAIKRLGVDFHPKLVQGIMTEQRGCASKLLLQLKTVLEGKRLKHLIRTDGRSDSCLFVVVL
jgi:hypothetical protein